MQSEKQNTLNALNVYVPLIKYEIGS